MTQEQDKVLKKKDYLFNYDMMTISSSRSSGNSCSYYYLFVSFTQVNTFRDQIYKCR